MKEKDTHLRRRTKKRRVSTIHLPQGNFLVPPVIKVLRTLPKNEFLTIECKKGNLYKGFLEEIDEYSNITLLKAEKSTINNSSSWKQMESVVIKGTQVQFITLPPNFDSISSIKEAERRKKAATERYLNYLDNLGKKKKQPRKNKPLYSSSTKVNKHPSKNNKRKERK